MEASAAPLQMSGGRKASQGEDTAPEGQGQSGLVKLLGQHKSSGTGQVNSANAKGGGPSSSTAGKDGDARKAQGGPSQLPTPQNAPLAHPHASAENGAGMSTPPDSGVPAVHQPAARLADVLEGSLWTKRLAPSSEDMVNNLVARIFCGVRDHFVLSTELKVRYTALHYTTLMYGLVQYSTV